LNPQFLDLAGELVDDSGMPKRSSMDVNQIAARVVEISTGEPIRPQQKNAAAVSLGRLGGLKGGRARADKLTPEERRGIAQQAAKQRWAKEKG
jgi:hypothetical protein